MKNLFKIFGVISVLSIAFFFQACEENNKGKNDKTEDTHTMMHTSQMGDSMSNNYACPMHKNITGKKGDKCSECGMDMTEMTEMTHNCSMHKDMKGMKGDKCSECGMEMEEMRGCCSKHK